MISSDAVCKERETTLHIQVKHPCSRFTSKFALIQVSDALADGIRFMDLSNAEVGYFISQVAASAASFGVAMDDLTAVGTALNSLFGHRCAPPTVVIPSQGAQLQSICVDDTCPLAPNATCSSYNATMEPAVVNTTSSGSGSNATSTMGSSGTQPSGMSSATGSSPTTVSAAAGSTLGMSFVAVAGGLFAAFL